MVRDLRGSRMLITGASSGIGRSLAEQAAREGARVAVTARSADRPLGKLTCAVVTHGGRPSGARFWKKGSSVAPLTNRLSTDGRLRTPRRAPSPGPG